jgi:hypothetical protein
MRKLVICLFVLLLCLLIPSQVFSITLMPAPGSASIDDTAYDATSWDGVTTIAPSKNAVRDKFALIDTALDARCLKDDSALTGDPTITDATPTLTLRDSNDAAGTAGIYANSSGGTNDIVLTMGVEDSSGESTGYVEFDGVNERINLLKSTQGSLLTLTTGIVLSNGNYIVGDSTNDHSIYIQAYSSGGKVNVITITNDTGGLPEVTIDNSELTLPQLTGAVSTTGALTGLTKVTTITKCEGLTEDGGADSNTLFTDSGESLTVDAYIGMTIYNTTDVSSATVTDNNGTTITCDGLTGGTDNLFQNGDAIALGPGPRQSNSMFFINAATTILHPATAGYVAGYYCLGSNVIKIDPQSDSMTINFDDDGTYTDPGAGDEIDGDGTAGDFIIIINSSTAEAHSLGVNGSWADGGAS